LKYSRLILSAFSISLSGYHHGLLIIVPKSKQPVLNLVVQSTELPNFGSFQFLEQFGISLPLLHSPDIAVYLLGNNWGKPLDKIVCFLRQYQPESTVTHIGSIFLAAKII